jgi:hypothetical protein
MEGAYQDRDRHSSRRGVRAGLAHLTVSSWTSAALDDLGQRRPDQSLERGTGPTTATDVLVHRGARHTHPRHPHPRPRWVRALWACWDHPHRPRPRPALRRATTRRSDLTKRAGTRARHRRLPRPPRRPGRCRAAAGSRGSPADIRADSARGHVRGGGPDRQIRTLSTPRPPAVSSQLRQQDETQRAADARRRSRRRHSVG